MKLIRALILALVVGFSFVDVPAHAFIVGAPPGGANGGCPVVPPLDNQAGAVAAFSFRLLRTAYAGSNVVTIQRSSDTTQKTFTISPPRCEINTTDAFFDGSTYTLATWYDQSGSGNNVTQATNANRPTVILNCLNSHPCANFVQATNQYLLDGSLTTGVAASSFVYVAQYTQVPVTSTLALWIGDTVNNINTGWSASSHLCVNSKTVASTGYSGTSSCSTAFHKFGSINNTTLTRIYVDGVAGTDNTATSGAMTTKTNLVVGSTGTLSASMDGRIAEAIVFAPDLSGSSIATVNANQGSYWGL